MWEVEMDVWDGRSKKKQYIYIKKDEKKKTYLGPKRRVLARRSGPRDDGGEVGEVWEVRRRHRVPVASRNRAKKTETLKTMQKNNFKNKYLGPEWHVKMRRSGPRNDGGWGGWGVGGEAKASCPGG